VLADVVPLRVHNNGPTEMKILVVEGGMWKYIGSVPARSHATFELSAEGWSGAPLRVRATPVGGQGAAHSDPLTVFPGQTVTFTIEADLAASSATVR